MLNNSPKPLIIAIKAIILHTFGVQVGFRAEYVGGSNGWSPSKLPVFSGGLLP